MAIFSGINNVNKWSIFLTRTISHPGLEVNEYFWLFSGIFILDRRAARPVRPSSTNHGPILLGHDLQGVLGSFTGDAAASGISNSK